MSTDVSSYPKISDWLVAAARRREDAACRDIVDTLYPLLISIIRRLLPRCESEEDLAQDVFIKIFTRLHQYRGDQPFEHWASRITTLTCYDALRKQRRRPHLLFSDLTPEETQALPTQENHFETGAAAKELVDRLLNTLKPREQIVIRLLDLAEKSVAEVSAETGWSHSKVKVTAMRARRNLAASLKRVESQAQ